MNRQTKSIRMASRANAFTLFARRRTFLKDERPESARQRERIAEGKGVHREAKSEGSRMLEKANHGQTSGLTNRNRIKGYMRG